MHLHEALARGIASYGFAHVTGWPGVATVTEGPGITPSVTALTDAARARRSLLVLAGDIPLTVHVGPPTLIDVRINPHTVTFSGHDHVPRDAE